MNPLRISLGDLTYTTISLATEAFPLNVGFVAAYCAKKFGKAVDIEIFKYIDDLEEAIKENPPDILGLSNYPWNCNVSLTFFKYVRKLSPNTICVMGGPNIPLEEKTRDIFLKQHPEIDFYAYLEGEDAFSNLVERVLEVGSDRKLIKKVPINGMIHCLDEKTILKGEFLPRRKFLDEIPSPYLNGFMDKFFDGILSPLLETNRGCPFSCTFCHEGNSLITKVNYFSVERIKEELDYIAERLPPQVNNLLFADPNFGMFERDYEICQHINSIQKRKKWPKSIFASTGKNNHERIAKALELLGGTMQIWLSVQSLDQEVLKQIKRSNIKVEEMIKLRGTFKKLGLPTKSEIILGLPGETYESHIRTISDIVELDIDNICLYTLMLLNGTELGLPSTREKYGLKTHFRILPRDFGKLSDGTQVAEIEEVVTSTSSLSFEDYCKLRVLHLIINVTYNGKGLAPIFEFMKEQGLPVFEFLVRLVENLDQAPKDVQDIVNSFMKLTKEELWNSREELEAYLKKESTYDLLMQEKIGINLIQTHVAMSIKIMDRWVQYVVETGANYMKESGKETREVCLLLENVANYCKGRVHDLLGPTRGRHNPSFTFQYDVDSWFHEDNRGPLKSYKTSHTLSLAFRFTDEKLKEIDSYLERFGTTNSGIGKILTKINITQMWRRPEKEADLSQGV